MRDDMLSQSEEQKKDVQLILDRKAQLKTDRSTWDYSFSEIRRFVSPDSQDFYDEDKSGGDKSSYDYLLDSTAGRSIDNLASVLHSHLTNTSDRWFSLKPSRNFKDDKKVQAWLMDIRDILFDDIFANPRTKFGTAMDEFYKSFCTYGTGILYVENDMRRIKFRSVGLQQCFIAEDDMKEVDTLYRCYTMNAKDIVHLYRKELEKVENGDLIKTFQDKPFVKHSIIHAVEPRILRDRRKKDKYNMAWRSVYILENEKILLSEGGYKRFPYFVARYSRRSDEMYGRSPVHRSMPEIKMINAIKQTVIKAAQLAVFPPVMTSSDIFAGKQVSIKPGAIVPVRPGTVIENIFDNTQPSLGVDIMQMTAEDIRKSMGGSVVGDNEKKYMTAAEIYDNREKELYQLSATSQRLEEECFAPLVDYVLEHLLERHADKKDPYYIPAAPNADVVGEEIKVEYVSPIVRAVRSGDLLQITRWLNMFGENSQLPPEALALIDFNAILKFGHKVLGLDPSLILDDKQLQDKMNAVNASQQMNENIQDAQGVANIGKTVAETQGLGVENEQQ